MDGGLTPLDTEAILHPGHVYRRLARNPGFRRLWVSQFVSGIGDWLVIGLLIPLVTTLTGGSSFAVAGIMIAKIIPSLLFSSFIGVFVDRFDRRRLMIACDIARAVLTLFLLGLGLSRDALRRVGARPLAMGVLLWIAAGTATLGALRAGWIR